MQTPVPSDDGLAGGRQVKALQPDDLLARSGLHRRSLDAWTRNFVISY